MIALRRTDSQNQDFIDLVALLNADLKMRDGEDNAFYSQFSKIDLIKHAVVAYDGEYPIGCGAIREYQPDRTEVKRMYVTPEGRGKGVATKILAELESWAAELGCRYCILETGKRQPEAIALYKKMGYRIIKNYGPYAGVENSVCFEKRILRDI
ncbi:GNAT family N-acetyltransferase [Persicitalea sp.]|uniref:GNAT family N-acetyltransferase n=1 Tax=Persicitalea sp. TaxID=3100273 RepID=UPI0035948CBC